MGSFVFKWPHPNAREVHVTGTFDDWGKSERLEKVGDTWEKEVQLPSADQKILYKFVIDDNDWVIDHTAPQEDDGHHNVNNVLYPKDIKTKTTAADQGPVISGVAPDSTTAGLAGSVPLASSTSQGQPSEAHEESRSSVPGAFPETPANEPDNFSVQPLPSSTGIGNPVKVPAGEQVPPPSDYTSNTVQSTATTSKEDYERDASAALPAAGIGAGAAAVGAAAFSKSGQNKDLIPESSLPMHGKDTDALDAGPTISSAAPQSTTAGLAGGVPLEKKRQGMIIEPGQTAGLVPETVQHSIAEAHQDPEAAASTEAVQEKSAFEKELLSKVHSTDATGEPAPSIGGATTGAAASTGDNITSGETANKSVPGTDTSTTARGPSAGEVAGGAAVGGAAAAGTASAYRKYYDNESEPSRTNDAQIPTSSATDQIPGTSSAAPAAVSDGLDHSEYSASDVPKSQVPLEKTEGDRTEYAPPQKTNETPGVSNTAAAAVSDGTEDPTLADEPAVRMMTQNENEATQQSAPTSSSAAAATVPSAQSTSTSTAKQGTPTTSTATPSSEAKTTSTTTASPSTSAAATKQDQVGALSSPSASQIKEKKKKNRVSGFFKKIFD